MKAWLGLAALLLGFSVLDVRGQDREPFQIGDLRVMPGEMISGRLEVDVEEEQDCFVPVTVIHGRKPGKVLALVAGVHGYEYPPILALYRLKESIAPDDLSGTLILVHIAHLPAFQKRIIYYNPSDWKNLNRVFPGNPRGTQAERIAYVLAEEVVKRCDMLIDLHCGDGNEALIPYCYWMLSGNETLDALSRDMVLAFGIKHIIIDASRAKDPKDSKYLGNTAILWGKPAITTESGFLGGTDEADVQRNLHGILSVMRHHRMIPGEPRPVSEPVWIDRYEVVYSRDNGLFYPLTRMGYAVKEGEVVGYVADYTGRRIRDYRAPFGGIVLYILGTPPANEGEPLFEVGRIR